MEENTSIVGRGMRLATAAGIVPLAWSESASLEMTIAGNLVAGAMALVAATGWCPIAAALGRAIRTA